jgi:hypothetical protein
MGNCPPKLCYTPLRVIHSLLCFSDSNPIHASLTRVPHVVLIFPIGKITWGFDTPNTSPEWLAVLTADTYLILVGSLTH